MPDEKPAETAPAPETEPAEIGSIEEGVSSFMEKYGKEMEAGETRSAEPEKTTEEAEKQPAAAEGEKTEEKKEAEFKPSAGDEEDKAAKPAEFFVVNAKGEKIPLVIKADGKEYPVDSMEKLQTWAGLGVHANTRLEELKKAESMLDQIMDALQKGNIVIRDGKIVARESKQAEPDSEKELPAASEEQDEFTTPQEKAQRQEVAQLKKQVDGLTTILTQDWVEKEKSKLKAQFEAHGKDFFLAREKDIWELLGEVENGKPKYNVENAMRKLHDEEMARFRKFHTEHPELIDKDSIISGYLKEKGEREKAPVAPPASRPTPSPEKKTREYTGPDALTAALEDFKKDVKGIATQAKGG